ncbi:hypothetical protein [Paraburkholderia aspalathi]|uniref:hypothetical protein n=1 Tax=Paraburkholderia aspalathi TaxID=1324617 RepID=UPI0038B7BE5A
MRNTVFDRASRLSATTAWTTGRLSKVKNSRDADDPKDFLFLMQRKRSDKNKFCLGITLIGGLWGARVAQRIDANLLRVLILIFSFVMTGYFFWKFWL